MRTYINKTGEIFFKNSRDLVRAILILYIKSSVTRYALAIFPLAASQESGKNTRNTRD
jgi:hypothetical protein